MNDFLKAYTDYLILLIKSLALVDSKIDIHEDKIRKAIQLDFNKVKSIPSINDCMILVMGNEEGQIPTHLKNLYYNLNNLLDEEMT